VEAIAPSATQPPINRQIKTNAALANFQFISQCETRPGKSQSRLDRI
jgi:hypothetical protein